MLDFFAVMQQCGPTVAPQTMAALVQVESRFNPYAIGVVGGYLKRQPTTREEAVATAKALEKGGWNFSMGMAQVNRYNLSPYNLTYETVFDPCENLRAGSKILEECYSRAKPKFPQPKDALDAALSCYYSGNFTRGQKPDKAGGSTYVQRVYAQADIAPPPIPVVPLIKGTEKNPPQYDKAATPATPPASAAPVKVQPAGDPQASTTQEPPADQASVVMRGQARDSREEPRNALSNQAAVQLRSLSSPAVEEDPNRVRSHARKID